MREMMISHPMLRVLRRTGSEGPRHDPYAYEEIEVDVPGFNVVMHEGLADWIVVNGVKLPLKTDRGRRLAFEQFVGYTVQQLRRIHERLNSRCRKCGGRDFSSERGYPGEYLSVCCACSSIQGGYFCESEII